MTTSSEIIKRTKLICTFRIRNRQRVVDILLQVMVESGEFTVSVAKWNISNPTLFIKSLIKYKTLQTTEFSNVHDIELINFFFLFCSPLR